MGKLPKVVIVGRPNVGKSTFFNKIVGYRKAIVSPDKGVTRDRIEAVVEVFDRRFILVDTGGVVEENYDIIEKEVVDQVYYSIEEADLILFMVDGKEGLHPLDKTIADKLRRANKNVFLIVNKCDNESIEISAQEFYSLGIDSVFFISAIHKIGFEELFNKLCEVLPEVDLREDMSSYPKIAFVGRPNTGKSSLINKILGSKRVIVTDIPGTTRDAIDVVAEIGGKGFIFIDTAGLRRKSRVSSKLEAYTITRTVESIRRADVVIMLIDSVEGVTDQDKKIAGLIIKEKKPVIVALNKIDIFSGNVFDLINTTKSEFYFLPEEVPLVPTSAVTGKGIKRLLSEVKTLFELSSRRIKTSLVNRAARNVVERYHPSVKSGKPIKVYYCTQVNTRPPTFAVFANYPEELTDSYKKYFERNLAKELGFEKIPIEVLWRKRE